MDLLPGPGRVAFEIRRFDGDVAYHVEALQIDRLRERHKVRVCDEMFVSLFVGNLLRAEEEIKYGNKNLNPS